MQLQPAYIQVSLDFMKMAWCLQVGICMSRNVNPENIPFPSHSFSKKCTFQFHSPFQPVNFVCIDCLIFEKITIILTTILAIFVL